MKRFFLLFFFFLFLIFPKGLGAVYSPTKGIGVCHQAVKMDNIINWSYETTQALLWKSLEPQPGVYNFSYLDNLINSYQGQGVKIWLSIQTVAGNHAPPLWVEGLGAKWFSIPRSDGKDHGLFAPWDQVYLERLEKLLVAINNHLESQSQAYQDTVGGIMMMSGGMYGEMQLWSGSAEAILAESLHLNPENNSDLLVFRQAYYRAVLNLTDLYLSVFRSWPVALQLGYNFQFTHPQNGKVMPVDQAVVEAKVPQYPGRLFLKFNGLDPTNVGDGLDGVRERAADYYSGLFSTYASQTQVGFEIGHPWFFGNPPTQNAFWTSEFRYDPARFENIFAIAKRAKASFVCFQPEMIEGLKQTPSWRNFDLDLEGVYIPPFPTEAVSTPTPLPSLEPTNAPDCSCNNSEGRNYFARGDGNCDGQTNTNDYNAWFDTMVRRGTAYAARSDFNCNGTVGIDDFEVWRRGMNF